MIFQLIMCFFVVKLKFMVIWCEKMYMISIIVRYGFRWHSDKPYRTRLRLIRYGLSECHLNPYRTRMDTICISSGRIAVVMISSGFRCKMPSILARIGGLQVAVKVANGVASKWLRSSPSILCQCRNFSPLKNTTLKIKKLNIHNHTYIRITNKAHIFH